MKLLYIICGDNFDQSLQINLMFYYRHLLKLHDDRWIIRPLLADLSNWKTSEKHQNTVIV